MRREKNILQCIAAGVNTISHNNTINTYDIKEALAGVYGVEQLINMVLNEEESKMRLEDTQHMHTTKQHFNHVKLPIEFSKHIIIVIDSSISLITFSHLHIPMVILSPANTDDALAWLRPPS